MGFKLPPLHTLRLFEAAARHLSFKSAAQELGLTRSAVSHGIQTLEEWLGVLLFARKGRGLSLTEAGHEYLPAVRDVLVLLATATDKVPDRTSASTLVLSSAPTFAERVLLPRLHRFKQEFPDLAICIDTSHRHVEFPRDGFDLAIRVGKGPWAGVAATRLFDEVLVPVCSPTLAKRLGEGRTLCQAPLIHVTSVSEDWDAWAAAAHRPPIDCKRGLMLDTVQMAFDAAVEGLGIAIGRIPLVNDDLEAGRLVRFLPEAVPCETGYWIVGLEETFGRQEILFFRNWLLDEVAGLSRRPDEASLGQSASANVDGPLARTAPQTQRAPTARPNSSAA